MKPSYSSAFWLGAVVGLLLAVVGTLFAGATGGVAKLGVSTDSGTIEPVFNVPASALWIVVILTSAALGLVLAIGTRAIARVIDPDARSITLWAIGPLGAVVGAVVAFAVFPLGVSAFGTLADGVATVTVSEMLVLSCTAGIFGGGTVAWQSYIMARPPQTAEDTELLPAEPTLSGA